MNRVGVNSNEKGNTRVAAKQGTVRCFCSGNYGGSYGPVIKFTPHEENVTKSVIIRAISRKKTEDIRGQETRQGSQSKASRCWSS